MTQRVPPFNKHILILILLRSVENGDVLTLDEFMKCSEFQTPKTSSFYRRWLREMKKGAINYEGGKTLERDLFEYVNERIGMFGDDQHTALDRAITRL